MRSRRFWTGFSVTSLLLVAAFGWLSWVLLEAVDRDLDSRREREYREQLSEAIWRLDLWLAPLLGLEAGRPATDYSPAFVNSFNFSQNDIGDYEEQSGYTISPLVRPPSEYFQLHFELGRLTDRKTPSDTPSLMACSPSIPVTASQQEVLLENGVVTQQELEKNRATLDYVTDLCASPGVLDRFAAAERRTVEVLDDSPILAMAEANAAASNPATPDEVSQEVTGYGDWTARVRQTRQARVPDVNSNIANHNPVTFQPAPQTGPLVPVWIPTTDRDPKIELVFLRKITEGVDKRYQGFLIDWERLESTLIEQITDLGTDVSITPILDEETLTSEAGRMLATIPAALSMKPLGASLEQSALPSWSLGLTWGALAIALIAFAFGFRSILAFGEKRTRFASAVTHELRTPLTTFQLYSEMLADGMVADDKRQEYLDTLRTESERLSAVVENVLAYARVEEGREGVRPVTLTVAELIERVRPDFDAATKRAAVDATVSIDLEQDRSVRTDPEAVSRILTNLIDNAGKYASLDGRAQVEVTVRTTSRTLVVCVSDHGPGIPHNIRRAIFSPFDRGGRESSNLPGVGLGLALSRHLARELGGDLSYVEPRDGGASFELVVPLA